jgi:hypothetical protein
MNHWYRYTVPYSGPEVPGYYVVVFLLVGALLSYWVYQDAQERASGYPLMWAIGVFVGWFFTLVLGVVMFIVYLVRRPPPTSTYTDT